MINLETQSVQRFKSRVPVTVLVTHELNRLIEEKAFHDRTDRSKIVRAALMAYFGVEEADDARASA